MAPAEPVLPILEMTQSWETCGAGEAVGLSTAAAAVGIASRVERGSEERQP